MIMEWKIRTKERKHYDAIMHKGKWRKVFAFLPYKVEEESGLQRFVWLRFVMKKCKVIIRGNDSDVKFEPKYRLPEQLTQDILANQGTEDIEFDSEVDRITFIRLCNKLNIKDDK